MARIRPHASGKGISPGDRSGHLRERGKPVSIAMEYQLESVWPVPPAAVCDDVVSFWLAESALRDRSVAEERAGQLLVIARDTDGQVAGVSTAIRTVVQQLGFECFYYRTFVGQRHRAIGLRSSDLVWEILRESYRVLNTRFCQRSDRNVLGIYAEMENPSIMRCRNDVVWQEDGMNFVYIGRTPDGKHMRVWYFDGARIP